MQNIKECLNVFSEQLKQIPAKYIYIALAISFGAKISVELSYLLHWWIYGGDRSELLIFLEKLK